MIVPPTKPSPKAIDVTVPVVVLQVEHATVIGEAPSTEAPAVTVMTPDPERVVVAVVEIAPLEFANATCPVVKGDVVAEIVGVELAEAHLGIPFNRKSPWPFVPAVVVARRDVPLP